MRQPLGHRHRLLVISVLWMLVLTALAPTFTRALTVAAGVSRLDVLALASWCSAADDAGPSSDPGRDGSAGTDVVSCPACLVPMHTALGAAAPDANRWLRHDLRMARPHGPAAADHACGLSGLAWARAPPRA